MEKLMKFSEHACCWCGANEFEIIIQGPDLLLDMPGEFQFVKCCNCGLLRQNPYLDWDDLKNYYPDNYASYQPQTSTITSHMHRWDKRYGLWKRVKIINKYKPSGTWVDIGAGTGRILQEASLWKKWKLLAVEPVKHAAEYIQNNSDIIVINNQFEDLEGFENHFDIVTMWDVIEHLKNPITCLTKVRDILKPGGIFVFSTPNLKSWDRKVFNKYWVGYDLPRHLHLFPDNLLLQILEDIGFAFNEKKCIAGSHGAFMLDLSFFNKEADSKLITSFLSKGPDFLLPRALTFLPLWLLDKLKLGSNITYIVTKV
jgi:SAM-dependent methyltransferase